jgi:hypothetical protein
MRYRVPESAVDWHITRYNLAHREAQPVEEREARWDAATDEAVTWLASYGFRPGDKDDFGKDITDDLQTLSTLLLFRSKALMDALDSPGLPIPHVQSMLVELYKAALSGEPEQVIDSLMKFSKSYLPGVDLNEHL